jgi:two-component system phosphate regulon response regulator PhoB
MSRILIIEDERDLQEVLEYNFRKAGHEVLTAGRGEDGLKLAESHRPDLVLLDIMLPDIPGTEVCRHLKRTPETGHVPILILTAKGEEIDRVVGFELGADDYVVKPFSVRELVLRVQALLKRTRSHEEALPVSRSIEFGLLRMDREAHRAWVAGHETELTPLEFKLLATLFDRRNRVQTRDQLLSDVWGVMADVTTRTVDTHVKRLREKLGPAGDYIETVRGVGYRFAEAP